MTASLGSVVCVEPCNRIKSLALKLSEDGSGDVIYRVVEYSGTAGEVVFTLGFDSQKVFLANLMEEPEKILHREGRRVRVWVGAFEIVTLRIVR